MTGQETVNYLKSKYQDGKDYGDLRVIARKRMVQVHSASEAMQKELSEMGFEINGWWATKVWSEVEVEEKQTKEAPAQLFLNQHTGMIKLNGLVVIGQGKWNEAAKQYEIPADFQVPEWANA